MATPVERLDRLERLVSKLVESLAAAPWLTVRSLEFYDHDEPARLTVTTAATPPYEFKEKPVDFIWLYAAGTGIQVSLDKAVSAESFVVPNGAIIWVQKKTRRVYGTALVGTGFLYIWGFYNR